MKSISNLLITMSLVLLLSACNATRQQHYLNTEAMPSGDRTAAVLPFVNLTTHPNAGRIVGDVLSTELYGLPGYTFLESTAMLESLKGGEEDLEYILDKTVAQRVGNSLGVDTVFYGSVSEFRYKRGLDQSPVVGINIRMLDVRTGTVVWAASLTQSGGCFYGCDTSLNLLTQQICHEAVKSFGATIAAGQ